MGSNCGGGASRVGGQALGPAVAREGKPPQGQGRGDAKLVDLGLNQGELGAGVQGIGARGAIAWGARVWGAEAEKDDGGDEEEGDDDEEGEASVHVVKKVRKKHKKIWGDDKIASLIDFKWEDHLGKIGAMQGSVHDMRVFWNSKLCHKIQAQELLTVPQEFTFDEWIKPYMVRDKGY
ncbi:hypothetical protein SELMODRAFT_423899 [Selaginella moellendorffii]|uniref:Uncharacterized protein n=1 Tax=Selaginella moellendorffii TaxID=88036 RepID=D8SN60_SELML|nr:hypothetical protein SELMODRAFT_423899 [Selaginella moellendorffii]